MMMGRRWMHSTALGCSMKAAFKQQWSHAPLLACRTVTRECLCRNIRARPSCQQVCYHDPVLQKIVCV